MKKALITLIFPIFIVAGTVPLLFFAAIKPDHISSSNRRWISNKLALIYTENTKKLDVNTPYVLSFHINNKSIADTIQLRSPEHRYISNGRLFVVSPLKTAIDIYQINTNRYEGSLYVPQLQNKKVIAVHLLKGLLVAFSQNSFSIYSLPALNSGIVIQTKKTPPTGSYFNLDPNKVYTIIEAELIVIALIISVLFFLFKVFASSSNTSNSTTSISGQRTSTTTNTTRTRVNKKSDVLSV